MPRFFVEVHQVGNGEIRIEGTDVNHIRNVLRMSEGEELTISDGTGMDYFCHIKDMTKTEVRAEIVDSWRSYTELPVKLYLFQGLPKGDKMELIIQKSVELGVYAVIPVQTHRAVVKLDSSKAEKKRQRWQSIAESAAKQAGRGLIPKIGELVSFEDALKMGKKLDAMLIPYEKAEGMDKAREQIHALKGSRSIGIFIGPEGGFEEAEIEAAKSVGAGVVTLGRRILRTETAGLAMLSILMFEMEEN